MMKNNYMQKQVIETYRNRFVQDKGVETANRSGSECILFCKRVTPNVFSIKDGFAIVDRAEDCFNDGVCMIANFTKVVFVFGQDRGESGTVRM